MKLKQLILLFLSPFLLTTPTFSKNSDPCIQAQLDVIDSVWRPGWWIGGFFGNHVVPYGGIAMAYFYSPTPKFLPYSNSEARERYLNCYQRTRKRIQIENQSAGLIGLMFSYAILRYAMNMIWETPEKGDAPFFLPVERSGLYYIGGLALSITAFRSLDPELGEPIVNMYRKIPMKELCNMYGNIKIVSSGEDYRVRIINHGEVADLSVRFTSEELANRPGRWSTVEENQDFSIRFVQRGEDFTIREVDEGEGCNDR